MTSEEAQVAEWLKAQRSAMVDLLCDAVNMDSGSYDKAGVDRVGALFQDFLRAHDIDTHREPHSEFGDAITAEIAGPGKNARPILLLGHRDTVFSKGEAERRPFTIVDGRGFGPGVCDMKAGLVMNLFVAVALKKFGAGSFPVRVLITADEEIGSPSSRAIIERESRSARAVFNSEAGRLNGNVVTARKGGLFIRFEVAGKAAHSGTNFEIGASAINELAHKIVALKELVDVSRGLTLNVGLVSGGQSLNTVAPNAEGQFDMRYIDPLDLEPTLAAVKEIFARSTISGTTATFQVMSEFLPFVQSPESAALFAAYQSSASDIGMDVAGEFAGGCADSGFAASVGAPTLCGVGPIGGKAHTVDEFVEIDSIVPRAQTMAISIMRMSAVS